MSYESASNVATRCDTRFDANTRYCQNSLFFGPERKFLIRSRSGIILTA